MSPRRYVVAVDASVSSEKAFDHVLETTNPEDIIIGVTAYRKKYAPLDTQVERAQVEKSIREANERNKLKASQLLERYKAMCSRENVSCAQSF